MSLDTISAAAAALRSGTARAADLVEASLRAIDLHNPRTNAFIHLDAAGARAAARTADDERSRGKDLGPLQGIPISLKDLIDVAGERTTAASRALSDHVAVEDAVVVTRLRRAGAIVIGKTNLHEFALGTTSEESAFGAVRNPHDAARSAGGSSGGSAAAVAAGMGLGSIGTDTGGSVRIPASACGVVGLKPSMRDIPVHGVYPLSPSLDHVGPMGRTVQDVAWLWAAAADRPFARLVPPAPRTIRLGHLEGYFSLMTADVRDACDRALTRLREQGVDIGGRSLPRADIISPVYVRVVLAEAAAGHAQLLERRAADYTIGVRTRIESGRSISAVDYLQAQHHRMAFAADVDTALIGCDALVLPTLPMVAPLIGADEVTLDERSGERLTVRNAMLRQTQLFNMTGHPAISLPLATPGLPVGLQLVGARDGTARLLAVAAAIEAIVCAQVEPTT